MEFTFTSDGIGAMIDEVVDYLRGPRLWIPHQDYPDFDAWADRVHHQLKSEEKRALVAMSHRNVVGAVIYQRHKSESALEIKNLTVRPDMRGRFIARFLLRNAEIEGGADYRVSQVLIDAKERNALLRAYLFGQGYRIRGVEDLYGMGAGRDIVYHKRLARADGRVIRDVGHGDPTE